MSKLVRWWINRSIEKSIGVSPAGKRARLKGHRTKNRNETENEYKL